MTLPACAVEANGLGLDRFAAGDPGAAEHLLRHAYRLLANEPAILVNLGLAFMQQGRVEPAERCYRLALRSAERRVRRSAAKNLGFLHLWLGQFSEGWRWHSLRFSGEPFEANQWRGDPLNGQLLTIWNDVGMGDAFHFARYTHPLVQRGERLRWAVEASQIRLFQERLNWPLEQVVDRATIERTSCLHIPLMGLIPLLDPTTQWGRSFQQPTWRLNEAPAATEANLVGLCWASNPADRTMHAYKSSTPERLLQLAEQRGSRTALSLQTDEPEAHRRLGLAAAERDWCRSLDQIGRCQRVVSVDTAIAHLAAGAGRPVDLLLGNPPDWRWRQFAGNDQLWYPGLQTWPLTGG